MGGRIGSEWEEGEGEGGRRERVGGGREWEEGEGGRGIGIGWEGG